MFVADLSTDVVEIYKPEDFELIAERETDESTTNFELIAERETDESTTRDRDRDIAAACDILGGGLSTEPDGSTTCTVY